MIVEIALGLILAYVLLCVGAVLLAAVGAVFGWLFEDGAAGGRIFAVLALVLFVGLIMEILAKCPNGCK